MCVHACGGMIETTVLPISFSLEPDPAPRKKSETTVLPTYSSLEPDPAPRKKSETTVLTSFSLVPDPAPRKNDFVSSRTIPSSTDDAEKTGAIGALRDSWEGGDGVWGELLPPHTPPHPTLDPNISGLPLAPPDDQQTYRHAVLTSTYSRIIM